MARIYYTLLFIIMANILNAQISYPSTYYAVAGDTFRISKAKLDSIQSYNFQATGADYTWNFGTLAAQSQYIDQYETPNSTGYRLSYIAQCIAAGGTTLGCTNQWNTLSNLAHPSPDSVVFGPFKFSNEVDFYEKGTTVMPENIIGMSLSLNNITYPVTERYTMPDTVYHFPLAYNNADSCNGSYSINLSDIGVSFAYTVNSKRVNTVEGWGPLTTPYGYFASTLKLITTIYSYDTMVYNNSVIPIPADTTVTFSWFATQKARPVLVASGLLNNGSLIYNDVEYIDTVRCVTPMATFNYSPLVPYLDSATHSASVAFNNTSNNANTFQWNFGDTASGGSNTSTAVNASHIFDSTGVFRITLIACNTACTSLECDTVVIPVTIHDSTQVQANFNWLPLQPCVNDTINFTNTSLNANTYQWNFGDGSLSTAKNPAKVYGAAGTYSVLLIATGTGGADSLTQLVTVETTPVATINMSGNVVLCNGDTLTLIAAGGNTYRWSNGEIGDTIHVIRAGTYSVEAYNSCGNSTSPAVTVTTGTPVIPSISISAIPGSIVCAQTPVNFSAAISNGGSSPSYQWFKNGGQEGSDLASFTDTIPATGDSLWCVLTSNAGCANPAIVTSNKIYITVKPASTYSYALAICSNSNYDFNGSILTQAGVYHDTLTASNGCDSIVTLNLTVNAVATHSITTSICSNSSYNFNGNILTQAGTYHDTLPASNGCDSIVTLNLTVNAVATHSITTSICSNSSYNFNGTILTQAGIYHDTLPASNGCDSIVTLNLTVGNAFTESVSASICANDVYNFNGASLNQGGIYTDTLSSEGGCDSIVSLDLTVIPIVTYSISTSICANTSYNFNGRILDQTGVYLDTLTAASGCDSVVTLNLLVNAIAGNSISAAICAGDTYNFDGAALNQSGTYIDTLTNFNGCDSVVTLYLSINPVEDTTIHAAICTAETYNFNGTLVNQPGVYMDTLTTVTGCDSIITLNLIVSSSLSDTLFEMICPGTIYVFNNLSLQESGTYVDTLSARGGCDSIVTLNLFVLPIVSDTIQESICEGSNYAFDDSEISAAGTYYDTLTSSYGCDSLVVLYLQVTPALRSALSDSICSGGSYEFEGQMLSQNGVYADTLSASSGCDSIVSLSLIVLAKPLPAIVVTGEDTLSTDSFSTYQWLMNDTLIEGGNLQQYVALQNGMFSVFVSNDNGCVDTSAAVNVVLNSVNNIPDNVKLNIYPNPAQNLLHIGIVGLPAGSLLIKLYDMLGKLLQIENLQVPEGKFDGILKLNEIPGGIYYLRLQGEGLNETDKIIITK